MSVKVEVKITTLGVEEEVTGSYSYVDPTGSLITVNYVAGPDGYTETRTVQPV